MNGEFDWHMIGVVLETCPQCIDMAPLPVCAIVFCCYTIRRRRLESFSTFGRIMGIIGARANTLTNTMMIMVMMMGLSDCRC